MIAEEQDWRRLIAQARNGIERRASRLRRWIDPLIRRPLIGLAVIVLASIVLPLVYDVSLLLMSILPRRFRYVCGQAGLMSLLALGLYRLLKIKPGDRWPDSIPHGSKPSLAVYLTSWIPIAICFSLAVPILEHPDGLGFADWDFVLDKYEAARRTIVEWRQFPWWNPWCRGGFPLAAEPQIGVASIAMLLALSLGTSIGLRLTAILYISLAVIGADRLARLWFSDRLACAAVALVYGLNGAVLVHTGQGFIIPMSYFATPWLAYHAFLLGRSAWHGVALGFWTAFMALAGIQYITLYTIVLTALILIRAIRIAPDQMRRLLAARALLAAGICFTLAGWRIALMAYLLREDQREAITSWNESIWSIPGFLLNRPITNWPDVIPGRHYATYFELNTYIGPVALLLAVLSLSRGLRWWHILAALCGWLALGSKTWYEPSRWLADWPLIGSAHVVTRWRFVALLGLGLAAGDVIDNWRRSPRTSLRRLSVAALFTIAGDYAVLGWQQLPLAASVPARETEFPGPPVATIVSVRSGLGYPAVLRGYNIIEGYEPMLSYYRNAPTLRRSRGAPDYRGEAWVGPRTVEPGFWSPNRIQFQLMPRETLEINQNPGSWWRVNGEAPFARLRCAELLVPFEASADERGQVELTIHPRGIEVGLALHAAGGAIVSGYAVFALVRAQGKRRRS